MTLDGSLRNDDPSHADTILCLGPYSLCVCVCVCMDLDTIKRRRKKWGEGRKNHPVGSDCTAPPRIAARFRTRTCSFFSILLPLLVPLFYISFSSSFLPSRATVNGSDRADFGGDARQKLAHTHKGMERRFCSVRLQRRCIVSLLHSSPILRSTCVANLRKP